MLTSPEEAQLCSWSACLMDKQDAMSTYYDNEYIDHWNPRGKLLDGLNFVPRRV